MIIEMKIHSIVDVITNSSTTIYSYCDGCIDPAKELITEFIKTIGGKEYEGKTADDLFYIGEFCETWCYSQFEDVCEDESIENPFENVSDITSYIHKTIEDVLTGKKEKPDWMTVVEEYENYEYYIFPTTVYIIPRDEKYKKIGELLKNFLFSVRHEAING